MDHDRGALGRLFYRIFLLSILFGILWVKGYLWTVFIIALLLYLFETIVKPIAEMEAARKLDLDSKPEPPPRRGGGRTRWKWAPEDPT